MLRHLSGNRVPVAGQHDRAPDPGVFQGRDSFLRFGLFPVRDYNMAGIGAVDRHMDDRAGLMAFRAGNTQMIHQFHVAGGNLPSVDFHNHPAAADFLHFADPRQIERPAAGIADADSDRMGRGGFGKGRVFQQFLFRKGTVVDRRDLKMAHGQGAGLVKDHGAGF